MYSSYSAIKPLKRIQNAAARLVFNLPKFSHVTPLLLTLHWLPVEARIHYMTVVLTYRAARGTAPPYLQDMLKPYTPRALCSATFSLLALPLSPVEALLCPGTSGVEPVSPCS